MKAVKLMQRRYESCKAHAVDCSLAGPTPLPVSQAVAAAADLKPCGPAALNWDKSSQFKSLSPGKGDYTSEGEVVSGKTCKQIKT